MRTYIYKLTSDRGGAPCAPPSADGHPLLTLSICKPAIRRTAQPGDRIVGITSRALANREQYPLGAVIYAAVVSRVLGPQDYYNALGEFRSRPDCIYVFRRTTGTLQHTGRTGLHADPAYVTSDLGRYPYYRNARSLLCEDFRYFGPRAVPIPKRLSNLISIADAMGQGHRVVEEKSFSYPELNALFKLLWKLPTAFTPMRVEGESYSHTLQCASSTELARTTCRQRIEQTE